MANIEERVENLIIKPITDLGYNLYDVQYIKEGNDYFLRIFIENDEGISLEDCEKVTHGITDILDEADYIKEQYFLEVSSTGVEKVIRKNKQLEQCIGQEILIKLFKPINGSKEIIGTLKEFDDNTIKIQIKNQSTNEVMNEEIERKSISLIKKYYNWDNFGGND